MKGYGRGAHASLWIKVEKILQYMSLGSRWDIIEHKMKRVRGSVKKLASLLLVLKGKIEQESRFFLFYLVKKRKCGIFVTRRAMRVLRYSISF